MALLLDDDDVATLQPTRSLPSTTPEMVTHTTTFISVNDISSSAGSSIIPSTSLSPTRGAAVPVQEGHRSPAVAAITKSLAAKGGNGLEKMDALTFGKPRVVITDQRTSGRKRSAEETTSAKGVSTQSAMTTPASGVRCAESLPGNNTQPKMVAAAYSSSLTPASSSPLREDSFIASAETLLFSQDDSPTKGAATVLSSLKAPSQSASPPARPPKPSQATAAAGSATAVAHSTQPCKTQMKLSDFFSKMACKR